MVTNLTPILVAKDLEETVAFYADKLGFGVDFIFKELGIDGYASLYRDNFHINIREGEPPNDPGSFGGISIEVENVDRFYDDLVERRAFPADYPRQFSCIREHPPEDKEYGVRDLFLVDPNGYVITVLTPL